MKYRLEILRRLFTNKAGEHFGWKPILLGKVTAKRYPLEYDTLAEAVWHKFEMLKGKPTRILEVDGTQMREVTEDEIATALLQAQT